MPDWSSFRDEFPALAGRVFLDTAAFGQLPRCAVDAMSRHLARRNQSACVDFLSWFDDMDRIRESCARLVHCDAADIAFVPTSSTALAWLMQGLDWQPGDELLTLEHEFPNQLYQAAPAGRFGVVHRAVAWPDFYAAVTPRTRVVLLSTVNYATGFRPPMEEIADFLRERGVLLYVDGTQSVGALEFDVQRVRPAMLCVNGYKWLLSPNGAGFVYIDPELRRRLPPTVIGWRSDAGWREVCRLSQGLPVFPDSAQKYEGGMLPFPSLYGMGAALRLLLELGPAAIEARVLELAERTRAMLRDLGAEVAPGESQIVTARLPGRDSDELVARLRQQSIVVSARQGRLRVSPHFYNNEEDVEALRLALQGAPAVSCFNRAAAPAPDPRG